MWIEKRGRQHRVYYRNTEPTDPGKPYVPFGTRDQAQTFLRGALDWLRHDGTDQGLQALLGRTFAALPTEPARMPAAPFARLDVTAPPPALAAEATAGLTPAPAGALDRYSPVVGVTFRQLWEKFIREQRHLQETTQEDHTSYWKFHFEEFFGDVDLGPIPAPGRCARPTPYRARSTSTTGSSTC